MNANAATIYKIFRSGEWDAFREAGIFVGSPDDRRDGFIHFSAAEQVRVTAAKYFSAESEIILSGIEVAVLGEALRWEAARGGILFPHLYAPLAFHAVRSYARLGRDVSGEFQFPAEIA